LRLRLIEENACCLNEYSLVPISFNVTERLNLERVERGIEAASLPTRAVTPSYVKDYDLIRGHRPTEWGLRWDLSKWRFVAAYLDGHRAAGAAVVIDTTEIEGESARADVAVLWDLRVRAECRRQGIGRQLIGYVEDLIRAHGMMCLKAETQDVNVAACRFYARSGFLLKDINRSAYPDLPDEVQIVWTKGIRTCAADVP
jgi:GNAT superfamily N-acetyltransferase